ncbi:MAG: type II/IV secretion system protein [Verrucomicrobia bacterium]|nr:type II/IV secretion system protein [Verrucomicrobiota bacterium]
MSMLLHRESLVARLLREGLVNPSQVHLAETEQRRRGGTVARMLCDLGFIGAEEYARSVAVEAGIAVADSSQLRADPDLIERITLDQARRLRVVPLTQQSGSVTVAMADPTDVLATDQIRQIVGEDLEVLAASEREILNALDACERRTAERPAALTRWLEEAPRERSGELDPVKPDQKTDDAPVIQLVEEILDRAVEAGASDVHFEPAETCLRVRFRLDGLLFPDVLLPRPLQTAVSARLKILSDLDVAESRRPQDGRASISTRRRRTNLRISTLPTQHGESVVVRLLPADSVLPTVSALELPEDLESQLRRSFRQPHGAVIVTGPTGSGKSTTLYAVLNELNQPDTAVFTLEDPVEMPMDGVRQTQILEEAGLTYSTALRALLRQDPDVILVGETRDTETAQLMVRAALTGHVILTTLHTNDAAGAVPRLVDMGVEPGLLPGSLNAILAQRLVRRLCSACREPVADAPSLWSTVEGLRISPLEPRAWQARGCSQCRHSGYRGRMGVFELLLPDERFHDLIVGRASRAELVRRARELGMRSLFENGVPRVWAGDTTWEELQQATREE